MPGRVECDAALMDGETLRAGAAGALQGYLHAISVARSVMERFPYAMLVGKGANRFGEETNARTADMLIPRSEEAYRTWVRRRIEPRTGPDWRDGPFSEYAWPRREDTPEGTVIYLAQDTHGRIAAGSGTSGWAHKYPGRIGVTPIMGAGIYADSRYGACGCTHTGEMTIRCATAYEVVRSMRDGVSVEDACHGAGEDLGSLRGGHTGPVVIHAVFRHGTSCVLTVNAKTAVSFWSPVPGPRLE